MGFYYESIVRPFLFKLDPEKAHDLGVTALDYLGRLSLLCSMMESWNQVKRAEPIELCGLRFPNAVGLAAGMDKNGRFFRAASALGFGHTEIGTITWHKQPGNERPRVYRYPEHGAVVNRMGFNNDGAEAVAARLKQTRKKGKRSGAPLGINIGKSKVTPLDQAVDDYLKSFHALVEFADYIAINVSSPNTPDLRKLQGADHLDTLLAALTKANRTRAKKLGQEKTPIFLKIAPDLTYSEVDNILETVSSNGIDGLIATNTTIDRSHPYEQIKERGGLSGPPVHRRSLQMVNYISRKTEGKLPLIGVGGIDSPAAAGAMMDAGAHLVQIYTGMIYNGPFFAQVLAKALGPKHRVWV